MARFKLKLPLAALITAWLALAAMQPAHAAEPIVADGEARAQIVIAQERPRMATLAALELQYFIEKITGAELPITTEPGEEHPVTIYVGQSPHTEALGVTNEGLEHGAYRIVSGDDWLVLLGHDFDFVPPEPWARNRNEMDEAQAKWDEIVSEVNELPWGFPFSTLWKHKWDRQSKSAMTERYGQENEALWEDGDFGNGFWRQDESGSLKAVYAWLETLGARWYMPGELGEILPEQDTIELASFDETVEPDYAIRSWFWYNYSGFSFDHVIWARRIGLNSGYQAMGNIGHAHGHVHVHKRTGMQEAHPEYYALIGNTRDTEHRGYGTACYTSKGLEEQTIKFARFLFDRYDAPHVSIWPVDGFKQCQCEGCAGKSASELVWEFTDRVARELYKTHPDRLVTGGAYATYVAPPDTIEQFSPNVGVFLSNRGRPLFGDEERWEHYMAQVEAWSQRLAPQRILRVENNRFSISAGLNNPDPFPVPQARMMAKDLSALKGIALGEVSEESQSRMQLVKPELNHLPLYVQGRYFWDADQDIEALLAEYYDLFYGPAADQMSAAFDFAEEAYLRASQNVQWRGAASPSNVPLDDRLKLVRMLQTARDAAGDTVYGQRIDLVMNALPSEASLQEAIKAEAEAGDPRKDAPVAIGHRLDSADELNTYSLKEIVTGEEPEIGTSFQVGWENDVLVFDIRCEEPDMENLKVTADVWTGDSVAILLESPSHSYYQIEVNPAGQVYDADRGGPVGARWQSQVRVEPERGDDYWRVRVRIPVVSPAAAASDPNHNVAGPAPTAEHPWYFNIGRTRMRESGNSGYMFSPTGQRGYHDVDKFGKLVIE